VTDKASPGGKSRRKDGLDRSLPKRFYREMTVAQIVLSGRTAAAAPGVRPSGSDPISAYRVLLDGRPLRTPAKAILELPTAALAEAIAAEWEAQGERIEPLGMPLTALANSALDGVIGREAEVAADIVKYAGSDLVCYRADHPPELARWQSGAWDPIVRWVRDALGVDVSLCTGVMPVEQPASVRAGVAHALEGSDAFTLTALHVMTSLMGSALLALAILKGQLTAEEAWEAAHIDEDFQAEKWGRDAEAEARREHRRGQMMAACRLLELLRS
jgi:chaperone required for assembly of F1-ATPase